MPGEDITPAMLDRKMGEMTRALRAPGARDNGYEALSLVMNTTTAPTDPNSAARASTDGSNTAGNMGRLDAQVDQFIRNIQRMNATMQGGNPNMSVAPI